MWKVDSRVYRRRPTRAVRVGDVVVGGDNPIRVQSMTTPLTTDTRATVEQIERLVAGGCEMVRLTVPTTADADNLPNIRRELVTRGLRVPLIADIHFTPAAAMRAVEHVEKVRINPGNYADKKRFAVREYTDDEYRAELERIEKIFVPLVERCKELGVAMRIGTNHGSLSDRIMNRYGDSPEGMVESALEFVRICEAHGYHEMILSMKASNPVVVLQAYRLLVERMALEKMDYPLHLGVTEAGDGEDGRIKSAVGIGALLEEGIGDTVRVSLTEDPVAEIPVARALVAPFNARPAAVAPLPDSVVTVETGDHVYQRRSTVAVEVGPHTVGSGHGVIVEVPLLSRVIDEVAVRAELDAQVGVRVPQDTRAELVSVAIARREEISHVEKLRRSMALVAPGVALSVRLSSDPVGWDDEDLRRVAGAAHRLHFRVSSSARQAVERSLPAMAENGTTLLIEAASATGDMDEAVAVAIETVRRASQAGLVDLLVTVDPTTGPSPLHAVRMLVARLDAAGLALPVVLLDRPRDRSADASLGPSSVLGGLLCE
ncbi:MAG: (E)-4-hydroxy-3-methylbut-2-enyl-diphosphate synthase, partial [Acidobacteriota bacterium]|nr:(E)-4-hydroxy-3-methylbut-2-enyl-diphosphate synthase [Acidobacteriota bacterium]